MITLSEALSNFSGTTNYVAKYTPTGNVLGISQIFDNGTNVGIGTITPTSKLHIQGTDSTSSTYSLKVDNSASSPLLYVRNDGNVGIGTSSPNAKLQIVGLGSSNSTISLNITNSLGRNLLNIKDGIYTTFGDYIYESYVSFRGSGGDLNVQSNSGFFALEIKPFIANNLLHITKGSSGNDSFATVDCVTGNWFFSNIGISFNQKDVNAKIKIVGTDSSSSNYSLKVDNFASSPLLYVRNDGVILANNLPTSSAGLPSGAIWNNSGVLNIV